MMTDLLTIACSTCRNTMIEGGSNAAAWSIFTMLVIIVPLLACIGICMVRIARRQSQHLDPELNDNWTPPSNLS